jgi:hypothetical protein
MSTGDIGATGEHFLIIVIQGVHLQAMKMVVNILINHLFSGKVHKQFNCLVFGGFGGLSSCIIPSGALPIVYNINLYGK